MKCVATRVKRRRGCLSTDVKGAEICVFHQWVCRHPCDGGGEETETIGCVITYVGEGGDNNMTPTVWIREEDNVATRV